MSARILRLATSALLLILLLASAARAEDILRLEGPVTDTSGALAGSEGEISAAIQRTLDEHSVQVWVLFVLTTGEHTAKEYADQTATQNSLGAGDALLLVAMEDRTDYLWVSDSLDAITDDELDAIIVEELEPRLRGGDFAGAAIAAVEALGVAANRAAATDGGSGSPVGTIVALVLIGGGGYLVYRTWRGRLGTVPPGAGTPATPAPKPIDAEGLARQANALLIATDERIRDASQETDFAEAQYGSDAVTSFRTAVAGAREELAAAFTIRQRLDDAEPEDEPTRIAMLQEIVARTTKAQERLDAETERIRQLRDLERDAPNTLVELPARIETVEDRVDRLASTVERLEQGYAESVWRPVQGNLAEARKGIAGARTAVTAGSAAVATGDLGDVAVATRTALEGMTGAALLLDAIEGLAASVADAERRVPEEIAEATRDLADMTAALGGRTVDPATEARRRDAESSLAAARATAAAVPPDPLEALRLATEAHRLADEGLVKARDAVAAADRLTAAADSSVRTASAEVDRAATFIASRRRGVGDTARTRLAEAQRHLLDAVGLVRTDPTRALEAARRSQALAQEAYRLAQDDFVDWDQGGPGWGQKGPGGDETTAILGQILGGVIRGIIVGGGRSGGGWGGSPWGRSGGGGGFGGWGGGGGFGSGGFGGGGGGGSGGGGGRGRGGRW